MPLGHSVIQLRTTWTSNYFALESRFEDGYYKGKLFASLVYVNYVVAFLRQEDCMQCKGLLDDMVA